MFIYVLRNCTAGVAGRNYWVFSSLPEVFERVGELDEAIEVKFQSHGPTAW